MKERVRARDRRVVPVDERAGAQARLVNLGYCVEPEHDERALGDAKMIDVVGRRRKSVAIAALLTGFGCTGRSLGSSEGEGSTAEGSTTETTAEVESSSSSSGIAESGDVEASTSTSGATTGPPVDACPSGIDGLESSRMYLQIQTDATDFPEYPPPHGLTHADCTPLDFDRALRLRCTIADWELQDHEFELASGNADVQAAIASLLDHPTIALEMFAGSGFIPGWQIYQFTVRTSDGELMLYSYDHRLEIEVEVAIDPLGAIAAFDAGCIGRPAVHGHATVEQPWAVDVETDDGSVRLFDREAATVSIAETSYRIVVGAAFRELEGCGETTHDWCWESAAFTVFRWDR